MSLPPIRRPLLLAAALSLGASAAFATPVVYGERASTKVRPSEPVGPGSELAFVAARNEFVSFQVVVHGADSGAKAVRAEFDGVSGPGTLGPESVTIYREAYLQVSTPSGNRGATGPWPDGLIPSRDETAGEARNAFPIDVPAGQSRVVWVDLHVPVSAAPGTYRGEVRVTGSALTATVPVRVDVVAATLPSTASLPTAFLLFSGNPCQVATGSADCNGNPQRAAQVMDAYVRLALDHRVSLPNAFSVARSGRDWAAFDAAHAAWLDGGSQTRLPGARLTTAQLTAPRDEATFRSWAAHFRTRGWLARLYDYTGDEPPYGVSFAEASTRARTARAADPELRTLLTTTAQQLAAHGLDGDIDLVVPVVNFLDGTAAPYVGNQRRAYDAHLLRPRADAWLYQSCMSQGCGFGTNVPENGDGAGWPSYMVDRSAARNRAMPWLAWKYDLHGELYYETGLALATAWTDQFRFNGNGDGTLFYPGTPDRIGGATTVPLPSLRLKQVRLGQQDYEWLKLVADAGDPTFARSVVDALIPSAHEVTDDGARFDAARAQLVKRYLELTAAPVPPVVAQQADEGFSAAGSGASASAVGEQPPAGPGGGCTAGPGPVGALLAALGLLSLRTRAARPARRRHPRG